MKRYLYSPWVARKANKGTGQMISIDVMTSKRDGRLDPNVALLKGSHRSRKWLRWIGPKRFCGMASCSDGCKRGGCVASGEGEGGGRLIGGLVSLMTKE